MPTKKVTKLECPITYALDVVGDQWSMLIVRDLMLFGGVRRFDALCEALAISRNILTERLRNLVEKGIVIKQPVEEGGRRMEYQLTEKGWALMPILLQMLDWTLTWDENGFQNYAFVDDKNGDPIRVGDILAKDGRRLAKEDIRMVPLSTDARDYLKSFN
jgi:DNA-binding HxlR family transcriptional regulator